MFENLQNIASFAQLQFKGINISIFSKNIANFFVKISATVIEMLTFNKWSTARESVMLTTSSSDSWRNGQDMTTRSTVLQLLSGELVCVCVNADRGDFEHLRIIENDHTASLEITGRVVTETCFCRVIKNM